MNKTEDVDELTLGIGPLEADRGQVITLDVFGETCPVGIGAYPVKTTGLARQARGMPVKPAVWHRGVRPG